MHKLHVNRPFITPGKTSAVVSSAPLRRLRSSPTVVRAAGGEKNTTAKEREPWEFGRFLRTVLFFNPPPTPAQVVRTIVEQPLKFLSPQMETKTSTLVPLIGAPSTADSPANNVTLVAGGIEPGSVGLAVAAQLLKQGRSVRALLPDSSTVSAAQHALKGMPVAPGARLELAPAPSAPETASGVRQVVWCGAGEVGGNNKFAKSLPNLLAALPTDPGAALYTPDGASPVTEWGPVDDVVMGGASSSRFSIRQGADEGGRGPAGIFAGRVTTANNGGFASVRTRTLTPPADFSAYDGLELRVKGDGQRYKCIIRTEAAWDGVGYTASFDTPAGGEWATIRVPFSSFAPVFRARTMPGAPALNPASICAVQLMLSKFEYDGRLNPSFREGQFELPLGHIRAYLAEPSVPRLVAVVATEESQSTAGSADVGGAAKQSGVPCAVVSVGTLKCDGAPVGAAALKVEKGGAGRGSVSTADVAELCASLLQQPGAAGATFGVSSGV